MPVIFKEGTFDNPYEVVSSFLTDYIAKNEDHYGSLVVDLETTILEECGVNPRCFSPG